MNYIAQPISNRILNLKQDYLSLHVPSTENSYAPRKYRCFRSGDRLMTLGYLRGFDKHADALTTRLRTSYAEAAELYAAKPIILDNELLLGHLYLPEFSEDEQSEYDSLCDKFSMSAHTLSARPPRKDHIGLDFEKLLSLGIDGIRKEIRKKMEELNFNDADLYPDLLPFKKWEFYQCCLIELDAVSDLAERYSQEAFRLAEEKPEPRKSELINLGNMLKKVPMKPAESFYEAVQSVQFFLSNLFGLYPLCRPDRYLYPFYNQDIENGIITKEFAQELIDNFCLCVSDRVFSRAACGFIVGGKDESGSPFENELTFMFITALDHLKLPDPNGALAVCEKTSDELLDYSAEILSHGTSHPAFFNDDAITDSLIKNYGVEPADAVNYIHSTCAEISVAGKSKAYSTPYSIDMPATLLRVARQGSYESFDKLFNCYIEQIKRDLAEASKRHSLRILEASRIGNEAMRICALIDNCLEKGLSIYEGGEKYMFIQPIFVGFSTTLDSLIAIKELVFTSKQFSLEEFIKILDDNFYGNESLRNYIRTKLPHYGNANPVADKEAAKLAEALQLVFEGNVPLFDKIMPGTFSYVNHAYMGKNAGATFDGRLKGTSYSDGCGPVQGLDTNGPTAMLSSLTSWDQSAMLGGMVVNLKLQKENIDKEKKNILVSLLRTFMQNGGIELQINVVDKATLEEAVQNPEAHKDLIVRIGGFSDYFIRLAPVLQQEIIERTEY